MEVYHNLEINYFYVTDIWGLFVTELYLYLSLLIYHREIMRELK